MTTLADRIVPSEGTTTGYLIRVSRPRFWLYLAGPVVVGAAYAASTRAELFSPLALALFLYFLIPANVFLYGVNDIFDADIDTENPKKKDREVRYRGDWTLPTLVVFTGVLGFMFLPFVSTAAAVTMVVFLFLSVEYSAPPLRFKTTPLLDSVSNGLYVLPGVITYTSIAGEFPPIAAIVGSWMWAMGMHTFSAVPDIEPDRASGIRTTATWLGESRTYMYCGICWLTAAIVFGTAHPFFAAVLGVYPIFVALVALSDISVERAYWWFPAINTVVGTVITLGGLWVMLYG